MQGGSGGKPLTDSTFTLVKGYLRFIRPEATHHLDLNERVMYSVSIPPVVPKLRKSTRISKDYDTGWMDE